MKNENGFWYLDPVKSTGLTLDEWKEKLQLDPYGLSDPARDLAGNPKFRSDYKPIPDITSDPVVIDWSKFSNKQRKLKNVKELAEQMGFLTPSPDLAFLLRVALSNTQMVRMGVARIIVMHESLTRGSGAFYNFTLNAYPMTVRWLDATRARDEDFPEGFGFVFLRKREEMGNMPVDEMEEESLLVCA